MRFIDAGHKMVICMSSNIRNTKSIAIATSAWSENLAKSASICCIVLHQCVIRLTIYKSYVWKYGQRQQSNISRKKNQAKWLHARRNHQTSNTFPPPILFCFQIPRGCSSLARSSLVPSDVPILKNAIICYYMHSYAISLAFEHICSSVQCTGRSQQLYERGCLDLAGRKYCNETWHWLHLVVVSRCEDFKLKCKAVTKQGI